MSIIKTIFKDKKIEAEASSSRKRETHTYPE